MRIGVLALLVGVFGAPSTMARRLQLASATRRSILESAGSSTQRRQAPHPKGILAMNIQAITRSSSVDRKACDRKMSELVPSSSAEAMVPSAPRAKSRGTLSLLRDTRGANLVEYIIVVGLIALIAIVGFKAFGQKVADRINKQSESVGNINAEAK